MYSYAKISVSDTFDMPVLNVTFRQLCKEALTRKGIQWEPGTAEREYNEGLSTQVPARTVIRLKSRYRGQLTIESVDPISDDFLMLAKEVVLNDAQQFKNQHPEYAANLAEEIKRLLLIN